MTSTRERRQKLIELAKSRRAVGSSSGTEATAEPIPASPISVVPAESPETTGDKKRKRLVKAPTTVVSIEEESSGSPLVQRRKRGAEGLEGDATPIPQAQASPARSPSLAPLPSPPPARPLLQTQTTGSGAARSEGTSRPPTSPCPQDSATTTEGGGESSLQASGSSAEELTRVLRLTKQLLQNCELVKWSTSEVDLHLACQMVLSLEFSTQHRRLEKLEGRMSELLNQKESLQSDYEALQSTNDMLKGMMEEAKRSRALQVQETIKTEMLMRDAVAALDADLLETTGRAIQLEVENAFLRQQLANMAEALAANDQKLKEAESANATRITEKVVLETDKVELENEKAKLWEEAADTFADGFDLALEQVKCVFPEADYSQFAMDFEVVDGKIVRP